MGGGGGGWPATAALLGVMALGLAGCLRLDADLTIYADRTIDGSVRLGYAIAWLDQQGRPGAEAQRELLADLEDDAPVGLGCEPWTDETHIGAACVLDAVRFGELSLAETLGQRVIVTRDEGRIHLSGVIDFSGVPPEHEAFAAVIRVAFPGQILDQENGTVDESVVTWEPAAGERTVLYAVSESAHLEPTATGGAVDADARDFPIAAAGIVAVVALAAAGIPLAGAPGRRF